MDTHKIIDLLRGTIDPNLRQAEEQLNQVCFPKHNDFVVKSNIFRLHINMYIH